jgi:hypothetical protein
LFVKNLNLVVVHFLVRVAEVRLVLAVEPLHADEALVDPPNAQ